MIDFKLKRDLVFFDLEATGLNVVRDRIVQIAMIRYRRNGGEPDEYVRLINPGIPISSEAVKVHGITPQDVANKPTFAIVAKQIHDFIGDADLGGYRSNQFDVPLLMEEFARCGIDFQIDRRKLVDVQRIFYKMEPRTLAAAYKYYCGREMKNAHDALADVRATVAVLAGQLKMYEGVDYRQEEAVIPEPVRPDVEALHDFTNDLRTVDATQRMKYDADGQIIFNFGKYNGRLVGKTLYEDQQYYNWILNKEFSQQVKQIVRREFEAYNKTQRAGGADE